MFAAKAKQHAKIQKTPKARQEVQKGSEREQPERKEKFPEKFPKDTKQQKEMHIKILNKRKVKQTFYKTTKK